MEKTVISTENIKPSSPTPLHLKIHKISLLDQSLRPIFIPHVLYFPAPHNPTYDQSVSVKIESLKQSLSSTLSHFYPFAGRMNNSLYVDCNDEGIPFSVCKIEGNLSDFLRKPDLRESRFHLFSDKLIWGEPDMPCSPVGMIQVNCFDCGGIAIGLLFLHTVTDGATIISFIRAWAGIARDSDEVEHPDYTAGSLFPQNPKGISFASVESKYYKTGKVVVRRYVFDSSAISTLRASVTTDPSEGVLEFRPSRVDLVSALLWKCFMVALLETTKRSDLTSCVTHIVNFRRKLANPPDGQIPFGNFVWFAPASTLISEASMDMVHLIKMMRNSINKIDSDFTTRMSGDKGISGYLQHVEELFDQLPDSSNSEYLSFMSGCNFGIYDIDFGWGKPVWIHRCETGSGDEERPFINTVWLMDTREKNGIEAWVNMDERYIDAFENVQELKAFVSVDPSPLDIAP